MEKLLKHKDKILHFVGSLLLTLPFGWFLPSWLAFVIVFSIGIGIELGDFKHYGWNTIKTKDKKKIKDYLNNTFGDLLADGLGILFMLLILWLGGV